MYVNEDKMAAASQDMRLNGFDTVGFATQLPKRSLGWSPAICPVAKNRQVWSFFSCIFFLSSINFFTK